MTVGTFLVFPEGEGKALAVTGSLVYAGGSFDQVGLVGQDTIRLRRATIWPYSIVRPVSRPVSTCPNDTVFTFSDDGRRLYVGGLFTTIGGQPRGRLATIDKTTGLLTSWNPNANGLVRSIVVSRGKVFVGGEFTTIGGKPRTMFAVIDPETGQLVGD